MTKLKQWSFIVILLILIIFPFKTHVKAHEVILQTFDVNVKRFNLRYGDGTPFSNENCEIYFKDNGSKSFIQTIQTDKQGNFLFLPEKSGKYIIQCFSKNGHGIIEEVEILTHTQQSSSYNYLNYIKYILGILVIIIILFILIQLKQK